jgi:hypothetical protein
MRGMGGAGASKVGRAAAGFGTAGGVGRLSGASAVSQGSTSFSMSLAAWRVWAIRLDAVKSAVGAIGVGTGGAAGAGVAG